MSLRVHPTGLALILVLTLAGPALAQISVRGAVELPPGARAEDVRLVLEPIASVCNPPDTEPGLPEAVLGTPARDGTWAPVVGAAVWLAEADNTMSVRQRQAETDADGRFTVVDLPGETHRLSVRRDELTLREDLTELVVSSDVDLDLELVAACGLSGRVTGLDPERFLDVGLGLERERPAFLRLDPVTGTFERGGLYPGRWLLTATLDGEEVAHHTVHCPEGESVEVELELREP